MKKMLYIVIIIVLILIAYTYKNWGIGDLIDEKKSRSYFEKNGTIYYSSNTHWLGGRYDKVDADLKSFEILSKNIAKDKNTIFSKHRPQDHIDYTTFSIDEKLMIRDKNYVYEFGDNFRLEPIVIKGLDIKAFEYINSTNSRYGWSKDKNHTYFNQVKVNVDYEDIVFIDGFFYDKDTLYTDLNKTKVQAIKKIDDVPTQITSQYVSSKNTLCYIGINNNGEPILKTIEFDTEVTGFKVINDYVLSTKDKVVHCGEIFKTFDASTFEMIYDSQIGPLNKYYKDKNNVYFDKKIIKNADSKSIKVLDLLYAIDDNHAFFKTKIIDGADPRTFKVLEIRYSLDDKHVFYETTILKGADPKTFRKKKNKAGWFDDNGNSFNHIGERY